MKWGPIKTTSGLISASVNMAVFLLSGDTEYAATGKITGIQYSSTFRERKVWIEQMLKSNDVWASRVLSQWDEVVFDGISSTVHQSSGSQEVDEQFLAQQSLMRATQQFTDPDDSEGEAFDWGAIDSDVLPSPGPTTPILPNIPVFRPPDDDANLRTAPVNDPPPLQVQQSTISGSQSNSSIRSTTMRSTSASAQLIAFAPVISVSDAPDPAATVSAGLASLVIATDAVDGLAATDSEVSRENQCRR
ncbi:hypothetical protein H0H92_014595, partial [Tricholoma furcatifolium]